MPYAGVTTNTKYSKEQADAFCVDLVGILADVTGKPVEYAMASVRSADMAFGTSTDPCAYIEVFSIGSIGPESNKNISAAITGCVTKHLKIPAERVYLKLENVQRSHWGFNGSTF
ncbi:Macrophage migration inhibitory factor [Giardia muris]|uniref:L-dopachrome isomerase n=1 Tax=Giardia muris TaxID=5742 RepID=A0A4Z1TB35_GIAMU|nr:Macrophage migration inhibitory factor [Giardia muris]|eukprot:TNJ30457.1 Macrophage migration inhibitory factor [Giardia muris]